MTSVGARTSGLQAEGLTGPLCALSQPSPTPLFTQKSLPAHLLTYFLLPGHGYPLADDGSLLGKSQMYNPGTLHKLRDSESPGMGSQSLHFETLSANSLAISDFGTLFNHSGEPLRFPHFPTKQLPRTGLTSMPAPAFSLVVIIPVIYHHCSGAQPHRRQPLLHPLIPFTFWKPLEGRAGIFMPVSPACSTGPFLMSH